MLDLIEAVSPETIEVVVHDVSSGGVCLYSSRSLPTRQAIRLHPPANAPTEVGAVTGHIISCRPRLNHFRVGVAFSDGK